MEQNLPFTKEQLEEFSKDNPLPFTIARTIHIMRVASQKVVGGNLIFTQTLQEIAGHCIRQLPFCRSFTECEEYVKTFALCKSELKEEISNHDFFEIKRQTEHHLISYLDKQISIEKHDLKRLEFAQALESLVVLTIWNLYSNLTCLTWTGMNTREPKKKLVKR